MPANVINARDLDEEEVRMLERIAESLRAAKKLKYVEGKVGRKAGDGLRRSAGSWKGLIDAEELISNIYADRLVSTRPEVDL